MNRKDLKLACDRMAIDTTSFFDKQEFIDAINDRRNKECPICQEEFDTGEHVKVLKCAHWYHTECLKRMCVHDLGVKPACAVCRVVVGEKSERAECVGRANEEARRAFKARRV